MELVDRPPPRVRVAQLLAFVALLGAVIGAVGPAERVRTTYSWPPSTLPAKTPESVWYTPLLLSMHRPESISATLPCALPATLPGARSAVVLATARNPERVEGLSVTRVGDELEIRRGGELLDRVALGGESLDGRPCAYRLLMSSARWSLEGGPGGITHGGSLEASPMVTGLFSALDLRAAQGLSIDVTTEAHATRTTTRQAAAWTLAAVAAVAALLLVSLEGRRPRSPRILRRAVRASVRPVDAVVAAVLVGWWVISPAYIDDGWVIARERMFSESRGFSYYYSALGANLPLDYWLDWAHHWLTEASDSLLLLRLPALACLAVVWLLCRLVAARILGASLRGAPEWTLASVFLIGAFAWGMTLRPEPVTAILVTGVTGCMLLFRERGATATVALTGALVALSLSGHPAGVISLAAVAVAAPDLLRWIRPHAASATAIVAASLALLGVLLFVGADLEQRRLDAQLSRTYSFSDTWLDEVTRYAYLAEHHYGTPLRRASVALIGLALLAYALRRRREPRTPLDFPALVLGAGIVLLVATPSKWPSHFGTLLGVAAIAAACEAARIRGEGLRATRWHAWPFAAIGAVTLAVSWAWLEREDWNIEDLRTLGWTSVEEWFPVARLAVLVPLLALGAALLLARRRRREEPRYGVPWRVAAWGAPLVAIPVMAFTAAIVVSDTVKTDGWTLARQNLDTLAARDLGCGLGEDLLVPVTEEARAVTVRGAAGLPLPDWVPPPPTPGLPRYGLGPSDEPQAGSPWFELPADEGVGIFVAGATGPSSRLLVEWGRAKGDRVLSLSREAFDAALGPLSGNPTWRFFAASDLPERKPTANAIRIVHAVDVEPGPAVAVSAPVTYRVEPLAARLRGPSARALVLPNVLTYFPCARLPALRNGAVEVPDTVVAWENRFSPIQFPLTSPFVGVLDLYRITPLSLSDSDNPPDGVFAYSVDQRIRGAEIALPDETTNGS